MKHAYRNLFSVSALMLLFFAGSVNAEEAKTPYYDEANKIFYANGTAIVIDDHSTSDTGATITWEGGSQEIASDVEVYGGGAPGTSFDSANITIEGGVVARIHGGGEGTKTEAANVGEVTIRIADGTISDVLYAGGHLTSNVDKVVVNMTGGALAFLNGGCHASSGSNTVGIISDIKNSPCRVGEVEMNISGGAIGLPDASFGVLYGGGQGFSYTGKTVMNISGDVDLSKAYVSLSGSNGMTETAEINITNDYAGEIFKLYSINRGSMKNATFNINGGVINELTIAQIAGQGKAYAALPEAVMAGGKFVANITGGEVKVLQPGIDKETEIGPDAEFIEVKYKKSLVENASEISTLFGSSATLIPEPTEEDELLAEDLNQLVGKDYEVNYTFDNNTYGWIFNLKDETEALTSDIDLNVKEIEANEDMASDEVMSNSASSLILEFSYSGSLPKNTKFYYQTEYEEGTALKLYYYNEEDKKFELVSDVEVLENGVVEIELEHCSIYAFVEENEESTGSVSGQPEITPPATFDNGLTYIMLVIVSLIVVSVIGAYFKKQMSKN